MPKDEMQLDDLQIPYNEFFNKSDAGQYYLEVLGNLIVDNHEKAEKTPELARDYVQRARGARDALDHIRTVIAGRKAKK